MQKLLEIQGAVACLEFGTQVIFLSVPQKASDSSFKSDSKQGGRLVKLCAFRGKHEENGVIWSSRAQPEYSNIIIFKYFKVFPKQVISHSSSSVYLFNLLTLNTEVRLASL